MLHYLKSYLKPGPERVGFILLDGNIVEINNVSPHPEQSFSVDPRVMLEFEELISATWHTHPNGSAKLSTDDYTGFANWPKYLHLIVGVDGIRGYVVSKGIVLNDARKDHPAWKFVGDVAD